MASLPQTHNLALDMPVARALVFNPSLDQILVCLRAGTEEWELPGGKCTAEPIKRGCCREVLEETGIKVEVLSEPITHEEREFVKDGVGRNYMGHIMLAMMIGGPGKPHPQLSEVSKAEWLSLDEGAEIIRAEERKFRPNTIPALEALLPEIEGRYGWSMESAVYGLVDAIAGRQKRTSTVFRHVA